MHKVFGVLIALMLVGGVAVAQDGALPDDEAAIDCGIYGDTPAEGFIALRTGEGAPAGHGAYLGMNPAEIADHVDATETVGDVVAMFCTTPEE